MEFIMYKQPGDPQDQAVFVRAYTLVNESTEIANTLDLFLALTLFDIQQHYPLPTDPMFQIRLFKDRRNRGIRI